MVVFSLQKNASLERSKELGWLPVFKLLLKHNTIYIYILISHILLSLTNLLHQGLSLKKLL